MPFAIGIATPSTALGRSGELIFDPNIHSFSLPDGASAPSDGAEAKLPRETAQRLAPRILLAEDDYELRLLISQALQHHGYEVEEVEDGWHLCQRLEFSRIFSDQRSQFDLMVSDIRMPGVSGLEALAQLQQQHGSPPPVILITAFGDRSAYAQASRLGAIAFFDKPIDLDAFCAYVRKILPPRNTNQETGKGPPVGA